MNKYIVNELIKIKNIQTNKFKFNAYNNAINNILNFNQKIISGDFAKQNIKGVGLSISKHINNIINNNHNPHNSNLIKISGFGPVFINKLFNNNIYTIKQLKKSKIILNHHQQIGLKYFKHINTKIPRKEISKIKLLLIKYLNHILPNYKLYVCGSYRRKLKFSNDIDILIIGKYNQKILKLFIKYLIKKKFIYDNLTNNFQTKYMGICKINKIYRRIDIRLINKKSFGNAQLYFTGSKKFNIMIRNLCLKQNYSLNEYCLTNITNNNKIYFNNEKNIFKFLNIDYVKPKLR